MCLKSHPTNIGITVTATFDNDETCATICALLDTLEGNTSNVMPYSGGFDLSLPTDGFVAYDEGLTYQTSGTNDPLTTFCKKFGECPAVDPNANASGGKSSSFTLLYSHSKKCFLLSPEQNCHPHQTVHIQSSNSCFFPCRPSLQNV